MSILVGIRSLREVVAGAKPPLSNEADDYRIAAPLGPGFLARGQYGVVTLLMPVARAGGAVGRSGGGFSLTPAPRVLFRYGGRNWEQPAAILECTDEKLTDTFLVLVSDIARRVGSSTTDVTWPMI